MRENASTWLGWAGVADLELEPFEREGVKLVSLTLSEDDIELYYEGFSNDTLWPLYHDVIEQPTYHRTWWEAYQSVNLRFAQAVAAEAAQGATIWVHDYQLQLVPKMLRELRPDLTIGFFLHIPFPANGLFSQLPWRRQIIDGLRGPRRVTPWARRTLTPTRRAPAGLRWPTQLCASNLSPWSLIPVQWILPASGLMTPWNFSKPP